MSKNRITAYLMLLAVAAIWGAALAVIKATLEFFPFVIFLTYRFFLTSLILIPFFAVLYDRKRLLPHIEDGNYFLKKDFWIFILTGILGSSFNLVLLFWGIDNTTALSAGLIYVSTPVLVVITAAIFLKEKVTKQEILGLTLAVIGTLTITLSPAVADGKTGTIIGNLLVWASAITWVAYVLLAKAELKKGVAPLVLVTTSFVVGFLSLLPFALWQTGSLASLFTFIMSQPATAHLGVWYMALVSGAIAYWLYQEGQRRIEASEATIFNYLLPVFSAPLAIFWLGEKMTLPFLIGVVIIVTGVSIAEWKKRRS